MHEVSLKFPPAVLEKKCCQYYRTYGRTDVRSHWDIGPFLLLFPLLNIGPLDPSSIVSCSLLFCLQLDDPLTLFGSAEVWTERRTNSAITIIRPLGLKSKKGWQLHFLRLSRTLTALKAVISNNQATPIFYNLSDQFQGYAG
jgi:hypothetical protein